MKLSILVTTYNAAKYIDQALSSVFMQETEYDFEVIVGDDGSSDQTVSRLKYWKEKYPDKLTFYVMEREKDVEYNPILRASKNRLTILKYAKGEYITFLDGDDFYIDSFKLQKQIDILEKNKECSLCLHNYKMYCEDSGNFENGSNITYTGIMNGSYYWKSYYTPAATGIYRNIFSKKWRDAWGEKPFDDNLIVFNQLKYGNIYFIQDAMFAYRNNPTPWKEKAEIEHHFINLIDFELEMQIYPKLQMASLRRHFVQEWHIWKMRANLKEVIGIETGKYALKLGAKHALSYLYWNELKVSKRVYLTIRYYSLLFVAVIRNKIVNFFDQLHSKREL